MNRPSFTIVPRPSDPPVCHPVTLLVLRLALAVIVIVAGCIGAGVFDLGELARWMVGSVGL